MKKGEDGSVHILTFPVHRHIVHMPHYPLSQKPTSRMYYVSSSASALAVDSFLYCLYTQNDDVAQLELSRTPLR